MCECLLLCVYVGVLLGVCDEMDSVDDGSKRGCGFDNNGKAYPRMSRMFWSYVYFDHCRTREKENGRERRRKNGGKDVANLKTNLIINVKFNLLFEKVDE